MSNGTHNHEPSYELIQLKLTIKSTFWTAPAVVLKIKFYVKIIMSLETIELAVYRAIVYRAIVYRASCVRDNLLNSWPIK